MPDEVGREGGHEGDEPDGGVLGVSRDGLASGVVIEHSSPEVPVGQGQAEHPLARHGEQEGGRDGPRDRRPAGNPDADHREHEEERAEADVQLALA